MAIPKQYKLSPSQRQVLAIAENAQTKAGSHFGVDKERATVRELAKRKLMKITSEKKRTPKMGRQPAHGPELWAAITPAGERAMIIARDPDPRGRAVGAISGGKVKQAEAEGFTWANGTTARAARMKLVGVLTLSHIERLNERLVKPVPRPTMTVKEYDEKKRRERQAKAKAAKVKPKKAKKAKLRKVDAFSVSRRKASGGERAQYGGNTVTTFMVSYVDDPSTRKDIEGKGRLPAHRKADAIKKFRLLYPADTARVFTQREKEAAALRLKYEQRQKAVPKKITQADRALEETRRKYAAQRKKQRTKKGETLLLFARTGDTLDMFGDD